MKDKLKLCEFCGKKRKTASTVFNGNFCIECYETLIEHSEEAIKEIRFGTGEQNESPKA